MSRVHRTMFSVTVTAVSCHYGLSFIPAPEVVILLHQSNLTFYGKRGQVAWGVRGEVVRPFHYMLFLTQATGVVYTGWLSHTEKKQHVLHDTIQIQTKSVYNILMIYFTASCMSWCWANITQTLTSYPCLSWPFSLFIFQCTSYSTNLLAGNWTRDHKKA